MGVSQRNIQATWGHVTTQWYTVHTSHFLASTMLYEARICAAVKVSECVLSGGYSVCVRVKWRGVSRRLQQVAIAPRGNMNQLWYSGGWSDGADNTGPFVHLPWLSDILSLAHSRSTSLATSPHFSLGHRMSRKNNLQSVSRTTERKSHKHDMFNAHKQMRRMCCSRNLKHRRLFRFPI